MLSLNVSKRDFKAVAFFSNPRILHQMSTASCWSDSFPPSGPERIQQSHVTWYVPNCELSIYIEPLTKSKQKTKHGSDLASAETKACRAAIFACQQRLST
jgi:hypothetical protein